MPMWICRQHQPSREIYTKLRFRWQGHSMGKPELNGDSRPQEYYLVWHQKVLVQPNLSSHIVPDWQRGWYRLQLPYPRFLPVQKRIPCVSSGSFQGDKYEKDLSTHFVRDLASYCRNHFGK